MAEDEKNPENLLHPAGKSSQADLQPVVLKFKKGGKKSKDSGEAAKAKYSKGLEDIQILEGNFVRIAQRTSKAIYRGIDTYERERSQSSKKKIDGAIEDFVYNSAKAASEFMKETSEIPVDLVDSMNTKSYRKGVRKGLRRSSKILRMWRI
jgi:hypothetical protein